MGVVGSLPSPPPPPPPLSSSSPSTTNDTIKTLYEESIPSSDDCNYYIMRMDEADSNSNSYSNSCSNSDNRNKFNSAEDSRRKSPVHITDGPENIKIRRATPPTLATGRRSKFMKLEGDAALKRELRRERNREAARKLKEKRMILEQQLQNDIQELETNEQQLLSRIKNLESHKEQLEARYQHIKTIQETITRTANSTLEYFERYRRRLNPNVPIHLNSVYIKEEPIPPPSPQWQLHFSI